MNVHVCESHDGEITFGLDGIDDLIKIALGGYKRFLREYCREKAEEGEIPVRDINKWVKAGYEDAKNFARGIKVVALGVMKKTENDKAETKRKDK